MKRSRYSDEQIAYALRQAETGTAVADVCRQLGISGATLLRLQEEVRESRGDGAARVASAARREREAQVVSGRPVAR